MIWLCTTLLVWKRPVEHEEEQCTAGWLVGWGQQAQPTQHCCWDNFHPWWTSKARGRQEARQALQAGTQVVGHQSPAGDTRQGTPAEWDWHSEMGSPRIYLISFFAFLSIINLLAAQEVSKKTESHIFHSKMFWCLTHPDGYRWVHAGGWSDEGKICLQRLSSKFSLSLLSFLKTTPSNLTSQMTVNTLRFCDLIFLQVFSLWTRWISVD